MYDHVYVEVPATDSPSEDGEYIELRVFSCEVGYEAIANFIQANRFPQYLNMLEAEQEDIDAFYEKQMACLENGIGDTFYGSADD